MFDVQSLRRQFPALQQSRDGVTPVFLDGPGGTQVPQRVIDAIVHYLTTCNANHGGAFATSVESDAILLKKGTKPWTSRGCSCPTTTRPGSKS